MNDGKEPHTRRGTVTDRDVSKEPHTRLHTESHKQRTNRTRLHTESHKQRTDHTFNPNFIIEIALNFSIVDFFILNIFSIFI